MRELLLLVFGVEYELGIGVGMDLGFVFGNFVCFGVEFGICIGIFLSVDFCVDVGNCIRICIYGSARSICV